MPAPLTDRHLAMITAEYEYERDQMKARGEFSKAVASVGDLLAEVTRLRAELEQTLAKVRAVEQARCWVNEDGKQFVFADDLLAAVKLAAPLSERPSPDHSAVYLDQHGQVWSDYLTLPPGDDVLPMVYASEQARSRADLAADGFDLRVIGWTH